MKKEIESLFFYTRNDYLIVNNLMMGNNNKLADYIAVVNSDYKAMIEEMKANPAKRLGLEDLNLAKEIYDAYKRRLTQTLDSHTAIQQAYEDIDNLKSILKETKQEITLYRNIRSKHLSEFNETNDYLYNAFASCSSLPTDIVYSYGDDEDIFIQLIIHVPSNTPLIDIDTMPEFVKNEEGEVILPPFKAKINNIIKMNEENCKAKIDVNIQKILVNNKWLHNDEFLNSK